MITVNLRLLVLFFCLDHEPIIGDVRPVMNQKVKRFSRERSDIQINGPTDGNMLPCTLSPNFAVDKK